MTQGFIIFDCIADVRDKSIEPVAINIDDISHFAPQRSEEADYTSLYIRDKGRRTVILPFDDVITRLERFGVRISRCAPIENG